MQDIQDINNDSLTKPKKQRSQKQIESFEKTMRLRKENIEKRKEEKLLQSAKLLLEKNEKPVFNMSIKKEKVVHQSSEEESINESSSSSSSEEEEVIVVKSKNKKSKPKPKKKPKRKTIIFESSSEESSSEEEERYVAPPKNKSRVKRSEPEYNLPPPQHHLEPKDFRVYFI
jgi:hypothetical protein